MLDINTPALAEQPVIQACQAVAAANANLHLLHALFHAGLDPQIDVEPDGLLAEARQLLLDKRQQQLSALATTLSQASSVSVCWSPHGWRDLIDLAQLHRMDLVISEIQVQSAWERLRLSNRDWELIRHCPVPLWLLRPYSQVRYTRVVAALDPVHSGDQSADLGRAILRHAGSFAQRLAVPLEVINIVALPISAGPVMSPPIVPMDVQEAAIATHRQAVNDLLDATQVTALRSIIRAGNPVTEIIAHLAAERTTLLVMGAVSRSAFKRLLIGGIAEKLLDNVSADVLIVKPPAGQPATLE